MKIGSWDSFWADMSGITGCGTNRKIYVLGIEVSAMSILWNLQTLYPFAYLLFEKRDRQKPKHFLWEGGKEL